MHIVSGGLDDERVVDLLRAHVETARAVTPPGSSHALDLDGLRSPDIDFWSVWELKDGSGRGPGGRPDGTTIGPADALLGVGALKRLSATHGEVKSMHTVAAARRRGVGAALLDQIVSTARARGMTRLSLETGSFAYFAPAVALYRRRGFVECPPFASYRPDPNSLFMTRNLSCAGHPGGGAAASG